MKLPRAERNPKINEIDKRVIYVWISFYSVINAQLPRPVELTPYPQLCFVFGLFLVGFQLGTLFLHLRKLVGETWSRRGEFSSVSSTLFGL